MIDFEILLSDESTRVFLFVGDGDVSFFQMVVDLDVDSLGSGKKQMGRSQVSDGPVKSGVESRRCLIEDYSGGFRRKDFYQTAELYIIMIWIIIIFSSIIYQCSSLMETFIIFFLPLVIQNYGGKRIQGT